ncbi:MAG TPA: hypothetical protein VGK00_01710 [Anaerolineales bacterium]|jgi:FMN phosphatase YigB (HAD superfamily)
MRETVNRQTDENLYQPKIHSERIRTLYGLKQVTGKPMTVLLDQAIRELAERHGTVYSLEEEPVTEEVQPETWEEYREYRSLLDEMEYLKCLEELEKIKNE